MRLNIVPLDGREAARFFRSSIGTAVRGVAARDGRRTVIVGGILLGDDGRHWGFMDFRPGYATPLMLKHIKRFLAELRAEGAPAIYVAREETFPGSRQLLTRCGFSKTDEILEDREVWAWRC